MNLFILSELHPGNKHVGWTVSYSLDAVLKETCNATFIYPVENNRVGFLDNYRQRLFKSWFDIKELPTLGKGPNVLLIIGIFPQFLLAMHALGPLLKKFDLKVAYLLDGFTPSDLDRTAIPNLDYLFTIVSEVADQVDKSLSLDAGFLPLAVDTTKFNLVKQQRFIDIINYGRSNADLHETLLKSYNKADSDRTYFYSTFTKPDVRNLEEHVALLSRLLSSSKISLCFEPSNIERFHGCSPLLFRWVEGWAAGCNIVGKRPFGKGVAELLEWENSTIELPDKSADWLPFFEELLNNEEFLLNNSIRNYRECLLRHDWRYRIRDMFKTLELPLPEKLNDAITQLRLKSDCVGGV